MAFDPMDDKAAQDFFNGIPLSVLRKNLIKLFKDYGVTDETAQDLAEESGPYFYLLDRKTGELSEKGRKKMERWKDSLGDPVKEISFNNVMIGD